VRISSRSPLASPSRPATAAAAAANVAALGLPAALGPAIAATALAPAELLDDLRLEEPVRELLDREFREKLRGSVEHQAVDSQFSKRTQIRLTVARAGDLEVILIQIPAAILKDGSQIRQLHVLSYELRGKRVRLFSPQLQGEPASAFNTLRNLWRERENIDIEFVPQSHLDELRQGAGDLGDVLKLDLGSAAIAPGKGGAPADPGERPAAASTKVRLFLASSKELLEDRDQFELYLRQLNDNPALQGTTFEVTRWENFLDAMSETRLQDEYNEAVRECDIFVSLFFKKTGRYTAEEFDTAHDQFRKTGRPLIYTFFKDAPVNMGEITDEVLTLLEFRKKLAKLGHFYTGYNDVEHLKRQFRDQIDKLKANRKI
jgi:hypothetical protein